MRRADNDPVWPALPYKDWKTTLATLHMWLQIVGKVKLELTPFLNERWSVAFTVTARGLTTSMIPVGQRVFQVDFDLVEHQLAAATTDGGASSMPLVPRAVADFYFEFMAKLESLGIHVTINTHPVEVDNQIPFNEDHAHAAYDPLYVNRCWRILVGVARVLEAYRTPFVGTSSPVHFWWGLVRPGDDALLWTTSASARVARALDGHQRRTGAVSGGLLAGQQSAARTSLRRVHPSRATGLPHRGHPTGPGVLSPGARRVRLTVRACPPYGGPGRGHPGFLSQRI